VLQSTGNDVAVFFFTIVGAQADASFSPESPFSAPMPLGSYLQLAVAALVPS
jgi:hypothetical protein